LARTIARIALLRSATTDLPREFLTERQFEDAAAEGNAPARASDSVFKGRAAVRLRIRETLQLMHHLQT